MGNINLGATYIFFDCQKVNIFSLKELGQAAEMGKNVSLEIDCSNKSVCGTERVKASSYRIFLGVCLLSKCCKYSRKIPSQV